MVGRIRKVVISVCNVNLKCTIFALNVPRFIKKTWVLSYIWKFFPELQDGAPLCCLWILCIVGIRQLQCAPAAAGIHILDFLSTKADGKIPIFL